MVMRCAAEQAVAAARELHRAGDLRAARAAYRRLLAEGPGDADLLGLLGVLALQEGDDAEAGATLRQALALGGSAPVSLRNLNNLLALLQRQQRADEARALVAGDLPDWPEGQPPGRAERATVVSLGWALLQLDRADAASRLLAQAIPDPDGDADALALAGRLRFEAGDLAGACDILGRAVELAPDDGAAAAALAAALAKTGQREAAERELARIVRTWPVWSTPASPSQTAEILILNPVPGASESMPHSLHGLHFFSNFAGEMVGLMPDAFRFHSVFADQPGDNLPDRLPEADLALNNIVNPEQMNVPGMLERVQRVTERLDIPLVNPPDAVFAATRQKLHALLQGVPNLIVPRIERYRLGTVAVEDVSADIRGSFAFPVILRLTSAHSTTYSLLEGKTKTAVLIRDQAALDAHLAQCGWPEFYAIEYVDLRRPDGLYRKIRACVVGGEVTVAQSGIYREWMVSGWRTQPEGIAFYRENPAAQAECCRISHEPDAMLGTQALETLAAVAGRVPLDIFGIDFDVDAEGRVVYFEAGATMLFHVYNELAPADLQLPAEPFARIDRAIRDYVIGRIKSG